MRAIPGRLRPLHAGQKALGIARGDLNDHVPPPLPHMGLGRLHQAR